MRRPVVLLLALAVAVVVAVPATAQAPPAGTGFTVAQALALRTVTNPRLGEDFVAFTLVVPRPIADGPGGSYQHVGVIDGLGKLPEKTIPAVRWLVSGKQTAPAMQVRPRHREVSFLRAVDGGTQLFVQSIDGSGHGGEPRQWAKTAGVVGYRWRPDGGAVSFTSLDPMPEPRAAAQALGFKPVVVDEDWRHLSLWLVEENGESKRLTNDTTVFEHEWAADGSKLACACAPHNTVDDGYMFTRLFTLDVATSSLTKLVDNPGKLGAFAWSPDGTKLAYITAADRMDPHAGQLSFVDVATGQSRTWPRRMAGEYTDVQWPGAGPMCIDHEGVRSTIAPRADLRIEAGKDVDVDVGRGQITAFAATPDRIVFTAGTPSHPPELFLASGHRLTDSNPELAGVAMGEQTIERVRARDGVEIEGILIKPVGYVQGTKYPFVIVVHGGPEAHFSDGWLTSYANWGQLLAARGYVSWYPNYRSSTGYGTAFCKHDHGDPMGKEFTDHLDAIEQFAKAGMIDRERAGIGGGSYGGYTAAWAATKESAHFAAAVSFVPFVDLRTKWLTSDIPFEFFHVHYQEKWPWEQPGLLADRSPLTWATNCTTPLLLLGGTSDPRVHPSQPFMLYRAVKFGTATPVRYVQYPAEGHGNRTNVYQLDYALRSLQWFDHYLLGDPGDRRSVAPPPFDLDYPK